jgi:TraX protein.
MSQNLIKVIATIIMVIDHIGFVANNPWMRIIGRLSFPLFCWIFAMNWQRRKENGGSANKIIVRLLLFGMIAQIPHVLLFSSLKLNILLSLAISTITFQQIQIRKEKLLVISVGLVTAQILNVDYGWFAIICPLLMMSPISKKWWFVWAVTNLLYATFAQSLIQLAAIFAPLIVTYHNPAKDKKPDEFEKRFFYYFYPIHLAALAALKYI